MGDDWKWWIGSCDERFNQIDATTREEAIQAGIEEYGGYPFYIVEAVQSRINWRCFSADTIIDCIEDYNEEIGGEDPLVDSTEAQKRDLEHAVAEAIAAWAVRNGIKMTGWAFADQRNLERITPTEPEVAARVEGGA